MHILIVIIFFRREVRLIPLAGRDVTEYSEQATLLTILDVFGVDPETHLGGGWKEVTFIAQVFSGKIRRIHRCSAAEIEKLRLFGVKPTEITQMSSPNQLEAGELP